jgi:hypothetical protein
MFLVINRYKGKSRLVVGNKAWKRLIERLKFITHYYEAY